MTPVEVEPKRFGVNWLAIDRAVGERFGFDPVHPGEVLRLAGRMGCSVALLRQILEKDKSVTAWTAVRLERATGARGEVWLHLQAAWDLHREQAVLDGVEL